jgi:hypothetical protein
VACPHTVSYQGVLELTLPAVRSSPSTVYFTRIVASSRSPSLFPTYKHRIYSIC